MSSSYGVSSMCCGTWPTFSHAFSRANSGGRINPLEPAASRLERTRTILYPGLYTFFPASYIYSFSRLIYLDAADWRPAWRPRRAGAGPEGGEREESG